MAWTQTGNLRGPKGDPGVQGERGIQGDPGVQGERGIPGPEGPAGIQGERGPQGVAGEDGRGIEVAGTVATYGDLPAGLTEADAGDGYLVTGDGRLYIWSGSVWPANGEGTLFRGPVGPEGPAGIQGERGPAGERGPVGDTGERGVQGDAGPAGERGATWFTGVGAPGAVTGSKPGDLYLDTTSGTVYELA
jgi:hypothetical protein